METEVLLSRLTDPELRCNVRRWLAVDKNSETQLETTLLLEKDSEEHLKEIFSQQLVFGTAGLRALMGAGYSRINDITIQQVSQGLCSYLLEKHGKAICASKGVVIGHDARYRSDRFSQLAAATLVSRGVKVKLFQKPVHTPLVPFSLRKQGCVAGIMVTASHNPKQYNGYKVYDKNGVQIIPPVDMEIASLIEENKDLWEEVDTIFDREKGVCHDQATLSGLLEDPHDEIIDAYLSEVSKDLCTRAGETAKSELKVAYTALHGVGHRFAVQLLERFGFSSGLISVKEQCDPDPDFPTVPFPNPEEAGALDMSMNVANASGASLIIANDPDADRLACAEKYNGVWRQFTGDEIGIILAHYLAQVRGAQNIEKEKMLFVCSVVSSKMLQSFAEAEGASFVETPTGFKWMGNKAAEREESNGMFPVLVYEEALGYAVTPLIRDKDGVSAAAVLVELACQLERQGSQLHSYLNDLRRRYGHYVTNNGYKIATPLQQRHALDWLYNGGNYHEAFGRFRVRSLRDVSRGIDTGSAGGKSTFASSSGEMISLRFENGAVVTIRPSGTEPKFKWYAELGGEEPARATDELAELVSSIVSALPLNVTQY